MEEKQDLGHIKKQINSIPYFEYAMDTMNVVQSLHELKLYVSFLLNKEEGVQPNNSKEEHKHHER